MRCEYRKLVRDNIPEIIEEDNGDAEIRELDEGERYHALKDKLIEEVDEFLDDDDPEELADILEVVDALRGCHHISREELRTIRNNKAESRGRFDEGYYLVSAEITQSEKFTREDDS